MLSSPEIIAVVPLRAGSKGLPKKNIIEFNGLPLYMRTVHQALRVTKKVLISTDIAEIIKATLPNGCQIDRRPKHLSKDDVKMSSVISYIINKNKLEDKIILLLQATSPLRSDKDILSSIELFQSNDYDLVFTVKEQKREALKYGIIENTIYCPISQSKFLFENRQSLPVVYGHNGAVYLFHAKDFLKNEDFPTENIGTIIMSSKRSMDIDNQNSFKEAERIVRQLNEKSNI
tara:strand:- start:5356 stop:6051 length:696 start_codon:yes stop_codon:yes gene_type:complete